MNQLPFPEKNTNLGNRCHSHLLSKDMKTSLSTKQTCLKLPRLPWEFPQDAHSWISPQNTQKTLPARM